MLKKSAKILAFSTHSIHADHKNNGDDGIRTRDLSVANAALSQLSYVPIFFRAAYAARTCCFFRPDYYITFL